MPDTFHRLFNQLDARVTADPSLSCIQLALELGVESTAIEEAVQSEKGISFREYQEDRRLAQALDVLRKLPPPASEDPEKRAFPRFVVPGATICCMMRTLGFRKHRLSSPYPLVNLSRNGLAFLADFPPKPGSQVSLLLKFPETEEQLRLEGRMVYATRAGVAGYRYRAAVQLRTFDARRGFNSLESLAVIEKLEQACCRSNSKKM